MSYRTDFDGRFNCTPPLTAAQCSVLRAWSEERHDGVIPGTVWCMWIPTEDGSGIVFNEEDGSFYNYEGWLEYLIVNYLEPWGIHIEGAIGYQGEEGGDRGYLYAKGNQVRDVPDVITPGPAPW